MKRFLSLLLSFVIVVSTLTLSPIGTMEVRAAEPTSINCEGWKGTWYDNDTTFCIPVNSGNKNNSGSDFRTQLSANIGMEELVKECVTQFKNVATKDEKEWVNTVMGAIKVPEGRPIAISGALGYDTTNCNEAMMQVKIAYIKDDKDVNSFGLFIFAGNEPFTNLLLLATKDYGADNNVLKSSDIYGSSSSYSYSSKMNGALTAIKKQAPDDIFPHTALEPEDLWNATYGGEQFMNDADDKVDINNPDSNLSLWADDIFEFNFKNRERENSSDNVSSRTLNIDVRLTNAYLDLYNQVEDSTATENFGDLSFQVGGATSDNIQGGDIKSDGDLNGTYFTNLWNEFIGDHSQLAEKKKIANSYRNADQLWDFLYQLIDFEFDTEITETDMVTTGNIEVDIWDDFHIANALLRVSLAKVTKDEDLGSSITFVSRKDSGKSKTIKFSPSTEAGYVKLDNPDDFDLTPYQFDSLMRTYTNLIAIRETGAGVKKNCIISDFYSTEYRTQESDPKLTDQIVSKDSLMEAIEEFETYTFTTSAQGVIDIARLSSTLTKYAVYMTTNYDMDIFGNASTSSAGSTTGTDTDDTDTDLSGGVSEYNPILHGLLDNWQIFRDNSAINKNNSNKTDTDDDGITYAFTEMPSELGVFDSGYSNLIYDKMSEAKSFNAIQKTLYADSYVFTALNNSEFGTANKFDAATIRMALNDSSSVQDAEYSAWQPIVEWLNQCKTGSQYSAEKAAQATITDSANIWIFRCIIELHDTCDLLKIDPENWSPDIAAYYKLYEDFEDCFNALRKSPVLYGTGYTGGATVENPLGIFFSVQGRETSEMWNIGFANSSLYVPMVTNLYDASIYEFANDQNDKWISDFLYKYGFHRKALYISTDPNIVVNNKMGKSSDNGLVIATLRDLLNYNRDIQLYIDTSFYNADDIESAIGRVDYATLYQYMHNKEITTNVTDTASEEQVKSDNNGASMTFYNEDSHNFIDETLNLDAKTLLKDDDIVSYSVDVAKNVTKLGDTATDSKSLYDGYVLSADALTGTDNVFILYNYTPMTAYAVVSAIYRDVDIYNELATVSKTTRTVFSSSRNILFADGTTSRDWISYMNYLQLANLEAQMNKNVETQLDLDSPIFIDIFGNIVTESGFVIIPATSNATLCGKYWTPYTIGFGTYMAAGGEEILTADIPKDVFTWLTAQSLGEDTTGDEAEDTEAQTLNIDSMGDGSKGGWFVYTRDGKLKLKNVYLQSYGIQASVNWDTLNANSDVIQEVFWNNSYFVKAKNIYGTRILNIIVEVLRGAPIENIDYQKEGIVNVKSGDAGIVIAYALDEFLEALSTSSMDFVNSMTTMPNLAFMPYLKYVIYFGIKITLALFILVFLIRLFMSGVRNKLGVKEVLKLTFTVLIVVSAIYILPNSVTWSYDKANSTVLSDESDEILLYSTMRKAEGQQIGITNVDKIDENTQLLVQVDTVNPSWSKILGNALLSNEYSSFTELFEDALSDTPYYGMSGVVQKGSNVYIDISTIMDSTRIAYSKSDNALYNKNVIRDGQQYTAYKNTESSYSYEDENGDSKEGTTKGLAGVTVQAGSTDIENPTGGDGYIKQDYYAVYSFTSPYYVILDQLIANVNEFNQQHDVQTYTASIDSEGKVVTYDIAAPYLVSEEFMTEGYDILGLTDALQCERQLPKYAYIFDEKDKENIKNSAWYPDKLDQEEIQKRIAEVYNYARSFVVDHKAVIKHIPDEQLLKVLAFACSIKYNQVFHCPYGESIKLITVDNRDIMRFMLSNFHGVYSNVSYSFGRYVYQTSGTIGVILAAILCVIILVTTVLKPILIWALFIIIIINILFRELLFNKPNQGVEGYFIGCALFMCFNFIYSDLLKVCFIVADSNLSAIAAMILCIIVQILYLVAIGWLIYTQISDWKNGGYGHYAVGVDMASNMFGQRDRYNGRRRLNGVRTHAPAYPSQERVPAQDVYNHPTDEPQGVYITQPNRRARRNRTSYNGPMTLDRMRERDEEREASRYRR